MPEAGIGVKVSYWSSALSWSDPRLEIGGWWVVFNGQA